MSKKLMYIVLAAVISSQAIAADSSSSAEVIDQGGGVLKQVATGLEWAQADNGSDIAWDAAGKYCADKGNGWRLPSVAELQSLYDKSGSMESGCGTGFTCKVSPLFHLTGPWIWSNEASNSMSSWIVILTKGNTYTFVAADASKKRALCVFTAVKTAAIKSCAIHCDPD
tara:strand:- start:2401 stop:2907 length:507 start_codon:yes stop_codon:yes gene_type:complete